MKMTQKDLRQIIREEMAKVKSSKKLDEAPMGSYHNRAHQLNMAMQSLKKVMKLVSGVQGADEVLQHLSAAQAALDAAWQAQ